MLQHPQRTDEQVDGKVTDGLLTAAWQGDLEAFAAFYDHTATAVYGLLHSALSDTSSATQTTSRVYLQMWRTAPQFDPTDRSAYSRLMFTVRRELTGRAHDIRTCRPHHDRRTMIAARN